jgi:NTE family protein
VDLRIGIEVTGGPRADTIGSPEPFEALFGSSQIMMGAIVREKLKSAQPDVLIFPPIDDFAVLDFFRVKEILDSSSGIGEELKRGIDKALSASR